MEVEWYITQPCILSPIQSHTQDSCYSHQARQRPWLSAEHGFTTTISQRAIIARRRLSDSRKLTILTQILSTLKPTPHRERRQGRHPHQALNTKVQTQLHFHESSLDSSRSLHRQVQGSLENPSGWDITHTQWAPNSDRLRRLPPIGANSPTFPRSDPQMPLILWFITLLPIKAVHQ